GRRPSCSGTMSPLSILNYMKMHHVLSFLCSAAGCSASARLADRVAWKATGQTIRARKSESEAETRDWSDSALFGSPLEVPPSDGGSHIRANQERIIAHIRDTEAERRLPVR